MLTFRCPLSRGHALFTDFDSCLDLSDLDIMDYTCLFVYCLCLVFFITYLSVLFLSAVFSGPMSTAVLPVLLINLNLGEFSTLTSKYMVRI